MATTCSNRDDSCFRDVIALRLQELQTECIALLSGSPDPDESQIVSKSLFKCQNCISTLQTSQEKLNQHTVVSLLKDFTQVVMDKTYVEECRLVNKEFLDNDSKQRMITILDQLSIPEDITRQYLLVAEEDLKIEQLLGLDLIECLYWRRGALLYMYCHTVYSNAEKWRATATDFIKDSEHGVEHLQKMLNVRTSLLNDDKTTLESRDNTTAQLLTQGIFSDTHVLALMYAGELCCWHSKTTNLLESRKPGPGMATVDTSSFLDSSAVGKDLLERYIRTVTGPLKGAGWDTTKAEQYLEELEKTITHD